MPALVILLAYLAVVPAAAQEPTGGGKLVATVSFGSAGGAPGLRLGDLDGDGKLEFVMGQPIPQPDAHTPMEVTRVTAFTLTGTKLWEYMRPGETNPTSHSSGSDIPLQVYDLDGDGKSEVIAAFSSKELTVLGGRDGKPVRTIPLPQGKSATGPSGSNDCILIANLRGTPWPQDFIVKTRYTQVWGIDGRDGKVLWTYNQQGGDNLAHYGYAFNADADSMDEYLSGWQLLDHDGKVKWKASGLTMHIDAASVGDIDGNPANGLEIAMASQVGALYGSDGKERWRESHTEPDGQGIQQIAIGDFSAKHAGKEVILLERIGPRTGTGRDANILTSSTGELIWKEKRTGSDYGWVSVSERITNWDGTGKDQILTYRRTSKPPTIYDGDGNPVATFPHPGSNIDFLIHADLCGDEKEEVVVYSASTAWIFANGGCDLAAPPRQAALPQNRRLYNWSIYSGWEDKDHVFFTPGSSSRLAAQRSPGGPFRMRREGGRVRFQGLTPGESYGLYGISGGYVASSAPVSNGAWDWEAGSRSGLFILKSTGRGKPFQRIVSVD
ncbi:MAG: hypothetical protein ABIW76_18710 [Fibrobacteria bacterium]